MERIGSRITKARKEINLNQKELAEKCGITEATLSRYENDLREPKSEIVVRMADALNVTTDYLLGRTNEKTFTVKDEKSIQKDLKQIMEEFKTGKAGPAFYDGVEFEHDELALIENAMETALKIAKLKNKEKYTPHKYRKNEG